jgi:hypothetical protein
MRAREHASTRMGVLKQLATPVFAVLVCSVSTFAQQVTPTCPAPRSLRVTADSAKPDIAIIARVEARELRFNSQPQASLKLAGCPQLDTSLVVLRTNLPKPVQPGVTYRNIVVDFRLLMKLTDFECYLAGRTCPAAPRDTTRIR